MAQVNDDPKDNLDVNCLNVATSHSYSSVISIGSVHSKIFFIFGNTSISISLVLSYFRVILTTKRLPVVQPDKVLK